MTTPRPIVIDVHGLLSNHTLNFSNDAVLWGVCEAVGIRLEHAAGTARWWVTPSDAPVYTGTREEIVAFVRGYATAWINQKRMAKMSAEIQAREFVKQFDFEPVTLRVGQNDEKKTG